MTTILKTSKHELVIESIDVNDKDSWKVVQSEDYRPDRSEFLLKKFKEDFPHQSQAVTSFEMISSLASRSKRVNEWLIGAQSEYVLQVSTPQYLKDIVSPTDFKKASETITKLNHNATNKSNEELKAVQNYKLEMQRIEEKYEKLNQPLLKDKVVKILTINSTLLPISLQLMIENYVPAVTSASPDKKTYAREVLTQFKITLLKLISDPNSKDIDLDLLLKELSEK